MQNPTPPARPPTHAQLAVEAGESRDKAQEQVQLLVQMIDECTQLQQQYAGHMAALQESEREATEWELQVRGRAGLAGEGLARRSCCLRPGGRSLEGTALTGRRGAWEARGPQACLCAVCIEPDGRACHTGACAHRAMVAMVACAIPVLHCPVRTPCLALTPEGLHMEAARAEEIARIVHTQLLCPAHSPRMHAGRPAR